MLGISVTCKNLSFCYNRGKYIGKYPLSADVIWGKKYDKWKKKGENVKEKARKGKEIGRGERINIIFIL